MSHKITRGNLVYIWVCIQILSKKNLERFKLNFETYQLWGTSRQSCYVTYSRKFDRFVILGPVHLHQCISIRRKVAKMLAVNEVAKLKTFLQTSPNFAKYWRQ